MPMTLQASPLHCSLLHLQEQPDPDVVLQLCSDSCVATVMAPLTLP